MLEWDWLPSVSLLIWTISMWLKLFYTQKNINTPDRWCELLNATAGPFWAYIWRPWRQRSRKRALLIRLTALIYSLRLSKLNVSLLWRAAHIQAAWCYESWRLTNSSSEQGEALQTSTWVKGKVHSRESYSGLLIENQSRSKKKGFPQ